MNEITVECPVCRIIQDMAPSCLLLEVQATAEDDEQTASSASWICDTCRSLVALPIDLVVMLALVAAGASLLDSSVDDDQPAHPETSVDGSPFTFDDLLDFHERLESEPWLVDAMCREVPEECPSREAPGISP
jgi:hypothetical protein